MAPTGAAVLTGAIINIVTVLIALAAFALLRVWRKSYLFYDSKRYTPAVKVKPHALPSTYFGWVLPTLFYSEQDIIRQCGLDTAIYLRLLKFGFELFLWLAPWCLVTVLPTNYTDDETDNLMAESSNYKFSNFDKLSLANVQAGSHRMWVHIVTVYVTTALTLRMLWKYSKESVLLRIQYLANSPPNPHTRAVLVTDIPCVMEATEQGIKARKAAAEEEEEKRRVAAGEPKPNKLMGLLSSVRSKTDTKPYDQATSTSQVLLEEGSGAAGADEEQGSPAHAAGTDTDISPAKLVDIPEPIKGATDTPADSAASSAAGGVRRRKVYTYDLNTTSLDPATLAKRKLDTGATPQDLVRSEFELVHDGQVAEVEMVHDQSALTKLVAEYNQRKSDVEDFLDACRDKSSRDEPLPDPKVLLLFGDDWCKEKYGKGKIKKVPGFPFWHDRLLWLEEQILKEQEKARQLLWPSAFVTFKSRVAQSVSATGMQHHDETVWRTQNAPEPRELLWYNLGMTVSMRSSASVTMYILFWLMTMFYMIPVGAIQGLIDVDKLSSIPGLSSFLNNVVVSKLLQAIVPGLVLKIFLALVPLILATMMKKAGAVSESEVDHGVVSRFYIFQVVVVFFGNILASSFFSQAKQLVNEPTSIVSVLGTAIPQASTFFITYIFVNWAALAIGFLRIVGLVLMWLFSWLAGSPRVRDRCYREQYTSCGTSCAGHMMILMLGIVFCCINPIIVPSALAYFVLASIFEKYNNIFVYRRQYESSGRLWAVFLNQVMAALYIFQLCMIGLIAIKKFPYSPLIIPAPLITIVFHVVVLRLFARPWNIMSLHDSAELDINDKVAAAELAEEGGAVEDYMSPVFKVNKGDAAALLDELAVWEPRVAADVKRREAEKEAAKASKKGKGGSSPAIASAVETGEAAVAVEVAEQGAPAKPTAA